jgi:hypothetical protein
MPKVYHYRTYKSRPVLPTAVDGASHYSGKVYPSGRVTLGYVPPRKVLKTDERYEHERDKYEFIQRETWHGEQGLVRDTITRPVGQPAFSTRLVNRSESSQGDVCPKRQYGKHGITRHGRRSVLEGATLLQRRYPRRLGFYTLTCPYSDVSQIYEFNRNIAEIVRQYFQTLKRRHPDDRKFSYVAAIEVQTQRYNDTGIFALHVHYVMPCYEPHTQKFIFTADDLRSIWHHTCSQIVGGDPPVGASVDAQIVRKDAAGYLSKYLSKGTGVVAMIADIAPSQLPKQWWSMSASVRRALAFGVVALPHTTAAYMFAAAERRDADVLVVSHLIRVTVGGVEVSVGAFGILTHQWYRELWMHKTVNEACRKYL